MPLYYSEDHNRYNPIFSITGNKLMFSSFQDGITFDIGGVNVTSLSNNFGCQVMGKRVDKHCDHPVVVEWSQFLYNRYFAKLPAEIINVVEFIDHVNMYRLGNITDACFSPREPIQHIHQVQINNTVRCPSTHTYVVSHMSSCVVMCHHVSSYVAICIVICSHM